MAKNEKTFNEQNMRKIIRILSGLSASQQQLAEQCVNEYQADKTYSKDNICFYNGTLYRAKTVTLGNTPSPESTYFEMLDGVEEEIDAQYIETLMSTVSAETWDYLKDFINNDIISTTHAWSSSRAYTEIQNAIQTAKDYTLTQVANSSTGSYVIANGTDEVVDDKHLYLILNASNNYDIYALVNGTPTKIGDTSVNLNGLLTEANAETTYLKQADATATYATISTTDGLRTDLNNHINDAVAHLTQAERDKLVTTDVLGDYAKTVDLPTPRTDDEIKTLANGQIDDGIANSSILGYRKAAELGITDANDLPIGFATGYGLANSPFNGWVNYITTYYDCNPNYVQQLAFSMEDANIYTRINGNGTWGDWRLVGTKKLVIGSPTVIEDHLATLKPDIDVVYAGTNTGELVNVTGEPIFLVKYRKIGILETQEAFNPNNGKSIACRAKNWWDGTWSSWELTRSKVADVAKASITFSDETNYSVVNNSCLYFVKNGMCTMMLYIQCNTPSTSWVTVANVPKADTLNYYQHLTNGGGDKFMECLIKTDGALQFHGGTAGTSYLATFSYPVAES